MEKETERPKSTAARAWHKYKLYVERAMPAGNDSKSPITYGRDHIFTIFIIYLLPICFISVIPGIIISLKTGYIFVAVFDALIVPAIAVTVLTRKINLFFKKLFVIAILYILAIVLIVNLGFMGPGYLYLLAISIIATLIFPISMAYRSVVMNLIVCSGFAVVVYSRLFDILLIHEYNIGSYIAVASNLIFLSWVCVVLISRTVKGLQDTITRSLLLEDDLKKESAINAQAGRALTESFEYYKSLFTLNPSPMWVLDSETGKFLQVNEAAIKSYGYTNEEFLSMTIKDIKLEKDMERLYVDVKRNTETGIPIRLTTQHRRKNNELFPAEVIFNSIFYEGKKARLVIALDITEQMIYTTAVENQNNKLREIAHIQSHLVRAPLATIMGLTHIFKEKMPGVKTEEIIEGIIASSEKLDNVIREIVNKTSFVDIA